MIRDHSQATLPPKFNHSSAVTATLDGEELSGHFDPPASDEPPFTPAHGPMLDTASAGNGAQRDGVPAAAI